MSMSAKAIITTRHCTRAANHVATLLPFSHSFVITPQATRYRENNSVCFSRFAIVRLLLPRSGERNLLSIRSSHVLSANIKSTHVIVQSKTEQHALTSAKLLCPGITLHLGKSLRTSLFCKSAYSFYCPKLCTHSNWLFCANSSLLFCSIPVPGE